jgi:hypothetical protein
MTWLVFAELIPEARREVDARLLWLSLGASAAAMSALQLAFLAG